MSLKDLPFITFCVATYPAGPLIRLSRVEPAATPVGSTRYCAGDFSDVGVGSIFRYPLSLES